MPTRPGLVVNCYRLVVWLAVAIAIVVIITRPFPDFPAPAAAPAVQATSNHAARLRDAAARNDSNAANAAHAPQQQVANGWYTNDQLNIIAFENLEALERLTALQVSMAEELRTEQERWEWQMKERRVESLIVVLGLGAAAHLAGSAAFAVVGSLRRRPRPEAPQPSPQPYPSVQQPTGQPRPGAQPVGGPHRPLPTPPPSQPPAGPSRPPTQPPTDFVL